MTGTVRDNAAMLTSARPPPWRRLPRPSALAHLLLRLCVLPPSAPGQLSGKLGRAEIAPRGTVVERGTRDQVRRLLPVNRSAHRELMLATAFGDT